MEKDKQKIYYKCYYQENREYCRELQKQWEATHKQERLEYKRQWEADHKDHRKTLKQKRMELQMTEPHREMEVRLPKPPKIHPSPRLKKTPEEVKAQQLAYRQTPEYKDRQKELYHQRKAQRQIQSQRQRGWE